MAIVFSMTSQLSRSHMIHRNLFNNSEEGNLINTYHGNYEILNLVPDNLRPQCFKDYIGQQEIKQVLRIAIKAACARKESVDHLLLCGPPGLGKTTIALILAEELGVRSHVISGPALERPRDIINLLLKIGPNEILFIDEIHRLNRLTEELLYTAMEDFRIDLTIGKQKNIKARSLSINPFTLIGATTKAGSLSTALVNRFGLIQYLDIYNMEELYRIIRRAANLLAIKLDEEAIVEIAQRCRGTPRIANRLLRRIRDVLSVHCNLICINQKLVKDVCGLHQIDSKGLDRGDRRFLQFAIEVHGGGPVGLETLAAGLSEDASTLESLVEPFLLQIGFLKRTSRGRMVTPAGYKHLGWLDKMN